jgi:predicted GIY-YIG superfamily endonuclease
MSGPSIARTIRIFLAEGTATGILTAEIMNWTGKIAVAPRSSLPTLIDRAEIGRTGVYFLVGVDPDNTNKTMVYVGEGDSVKKRLVSHNQDESKDFFSRVCVVVSKDENLTKTHVRHLESRLIAAIKAAGKAALVNGTDPGFDLLPESDRADMDFFFDQIKMVLPVLGFDFMQMPVTLAASQEPVKSLPDSPEFEMDAVGTTARGREVQGKFIVMHGSTVRSQGVPSWTSYKQLREQLVADGKIVLSESPEFMKFSVDVPFDSPSAAAAVISGRNANGRQRWKVAGTGQSYAEWQQSLIPKSLEQEDE